MCRWLVPVASRLYCGHHRVPGKIPSFTRLFFLESMDLAAFCRRNWRYGVWRGWIMRFVKGDAFFFGYSLAISTLKRNLIDFYLYLFSRGKCGK